MTPEEYLAARPDDQRAALESLRAVIASAAPGAELAMSYGVPTFKLGGRGLVSMGAAKAHCALYVMSLRGDGVVRRRARRARHVEGHDPLQAGRAAAGGVRRRIVAARIAEVS